MAMNQRLKRYLDQERALYETVPHREVFTAREVAAESHVAERHLVKVLAVGEEGNGHWRCGGRSSPSSTTARSSAGMSVSSMAASPRRKRERQNRPDQARQGHKVDGSCRWRGYSAGSILGRGVPGGGHPPREDARQSAGPRHAPAADCRSRLRQQRGPAGPQAAQHPTDHPRSPEQHPGDRSRRPLLAPVLSPVDSRAHDRLARHLPPAHGPL